jgi:hypothetical protein
MKVERRTSIDTFCSESASNDGSMEYPELRAVGGTTAVLSPRPNPRRSRGSSPAKATSPTMSSKNTRERRAAMRSRPSTGRSSRNRASSHPEPFEASAHATPPFRDSRGRDRRFESCSAHQDSAVAPAMSADWSVSVSFVLSVGAILDPAQTIRARSVTTAAPFRTLHARSLTDQPTADATSRSPRDGSDSTGAASHLRVDRVRS